jgi:hypothetical protein
MSIGKFAGARVSPRPRGAAKRIALSPVLGEQAQLACAPSSAKAATAETFPSTFPPTGAVMAGTDEEEKGHE